MSNSIATQQNADADVPPQASDDAVSPELMNAVRRPVVGTV